MKPGTETVANDAGSGAATGTGFDAWMALQKATDTKRANLIADIVGHPEGAPTVEELEYMNPRLSGDAIRRHLNTLRTVGVVERRELEPGERMREFPYQFFELTDDARTLFDRNGLFPEDAWMRQYQSVEKTPRIRDIETMPRPTGEE
ncbi:ArsR family transcriptional regulator [Natronolimnobius sp. AArcel1]|uniref:ArsR family transcriptional regulator n=1 Tax=Natronolimnobius sp. AArcel1 TaxID=1679093 RepID=UPI0013EE337B|nr:ArsR family transcriptional regulator [Natronolimnobius sp. AArcel1]NGM68260.1 ArsR family transcriptional regulator [Natronolimnobius sp. AArcel1]